MKDDGDNIYIDIFTPTDPEQRGAQLSLAFNVCIQEVFKELEKRGVVVRCHIAKTVVCLYTDGGFCLIYNLQSSV